MGFVNMISQYSKSFVRYLLVGVSLVPTSKAQVIGCDYTAQSLVITTQTDADAVSGCQVIYGDVYIQASTNVTDVILTGVRNITGNFTFDGLDPDASNSTGTRLDTFLAPDLVEIGGALGAAFSGPSNMTFSSLTTIGDLAIVDLAGVDSINFLAGLTTWSSGKPGGIQIEDTGIKSLDGIDFPLIDRMWISSNQLLTSLTIVAQAIGGSGPNSDLSVSANGLGVGYNTTASFDLKFPNLRKLTGYSQIDFVTNLDVPFLQEINGSFLMTRAYLSTLDFPSLINITQESINYFQLEDSKLDKILLPNLRNASNLAFSNNSGLLYESLDLPSLRNATSLELEDKSSVYNGLNCSVWNQFQCNGTVAYVSCLDTEAKDSATCKSSAYRMAASKNGVIFGVLVTSVTVLLGIRVV